MSIPTRGELLAILANPPLTDGTRTLRRTELAAELLGFAHVAVVNLFALPSHSTGDIATLGVEETGWLAARDFPGPGLDAADGVPAGVRHHRTDRSGPNALSGPDRMGA